MMKWDVVRNRRSELQSTLHYL